MTDAAVQAAPTPERVSDPLLSVEDVHVTFHKGNQAVQAVAGISFTMRQGETLGLVGESGCGKSTTGRAIVQVEKATSGRIQFNDTEITALNRSDLRTLRTQVQMIFQDPISSLNPRRRVTDIVSEPLTIWKIGSKDERIWNSRRNRKCFFACYAPGIILPRLACGQTLIDSTFDYVKAEASCSHERFAPRRARSQD